MPQNSGDTITLVEDDKVFPSDDDVKNNKAASNSSTSTSRDSSTKGSRRKSSSSNKIHHVIQVEPMPSPPPKVLTSNIMSRNEKNVEDLFNPSIINLRVWNRAKEAFKSGTTLSYDFRLEQLRQCKRMMIDCKDQMIQALYLDLKKPKFEAMITDYHGSFKELEYQITHLKSNMKPIETPYNIFVGLNDHANIKLDPYGVILIVGPWNYPINLILAPMWGAIAAGNCVILKPSEISKHTSTLLGKMIPQYLDNECYHVIEAELEGTLDLLKLKFDYILATGSVLVGKSIMQAAAEHLTPVTLELGGKCPVYIDESTNIKVAAKRVIWAKCINLGQSCIAPDYILCSKSVQDKLISMIPEICREWFGEEPQNSFDLGRIINEKHFGRIKKILDETKGKIVFGGDHEALDLWISPTILVGVDGSDISMADEIFGPILPIISVENFDEAIDFINARPKPLAIYLFSSTKSTIKAFKNRTSSGQLCINDVFIHSGWKNLPFGGVGDSGMGAYHDKYTFRTFSHQKAVLHRNRFFGIGLTEVFEKRRYPPHQDKNIKHFIRAIELVDNRFSFINLGAAWYLALGIVLGILFKFVLSGLFPCMF